MVFLGSLLDKISVTDSICLGVKTFLLCSFILRAAFAKAKTGTTFTLRSEYRRSGTMKPECCRREGKYKLVFNFLV